jgi:hypothetical protein
MRINAVCNGAVMPAFQKALEAVAYAFNVFTVGARCSHHE